MSRPSFPHLPAERIGIEITRELVMLPSYSTTLVIPLLDRQ